MTFMSLNRILLVLSGLIALSLGTIQVVGPNEELIESEDFGSRIGYPNNLNQKYLIRAPETNYIILLQFLEFDVEEDLDFLKIREVLKNGTKKIITKSGNLPSFNYTASTNSVRMRFVTNNRIQKKGFRVRVTFVNNITHCGDYNELLKVYPEQDLTCANLTAGRTTGCRIFREGVMNITKTCIDGNLITTSSCCNQTLVDECEHNESTCPITTDDVLSHYEFGCGESDDLSDKERNATIKHANENLSLGRFITCSTNVCSLRRYNGILDYYPRKCIYFFYSFRDAGFFSYGKSLFIACWGCRARGQCTNAGTLLGK